MKAPRHSNKGLHKLNCACPRRSWAKCPHPWHYTYQYKGVRHRGSLDRHVGREITSKTEAEHEFAKLKTAIREGQPLDGEAPSGVDVTLEVYAREWLRTTAALTLKVNTVGFYTYMLEAMVLPLLGTRPVSSIGRTEVRELIAKLRARQRTRRVGGILVDTGATIRTVTVGQAVRTLSTVLSQAVEDGKLSANPAFRPGRFLRAPDEEPKRPPDPFTREESRQIVDTASLLYGEQWAAWFLCAFHTGMRIGELTGLQWDDVQWARPAPHVLVRRGVTRGVVSTPKTKSGRRRIELSGELRGVLRLLRRKRSAASRAEGVPMPEWVFANGMGQAADPSKAAKILRRVLAVAGLRYRSHHNIRDTFGSLHAENGEPLKWVSEQMGHSSIKVTADLYMRFAPGVNRGAADRLFGGRARTKESRESQGTTRGQVADGANG